MARFTANLTMTTPTETVTASKSDDYEVAVNIVSEVDNNDNVIDLISSGKDIGQNTLRGCKSLLIKNTGLVGVEVVLTGEEWADASPDTNGSASNQSMLIPSGDFVYLPNLRQLNYETATTSAANGETLDNQAPHGTMARDTGADVDTATDSTITSSASVTTIYLEDGHSKYFKVGDLIKIDTEIMEVTAVGTGADLANSTLTVKRGMYGSTAATHADDAAVSLTYFNAYADYDKYSTAQTDGSGRYKAMNLFGYGRKSDAVADGFVAGSFSGKFYSAGYQELGLSGITSSTESGLTASTVYQFTIAVDGGSAYDLDVTTSTNTKFGGSDGVIQKIQDALDAGFYASGNLFEKRVTVGIVNGDIRFTSGQRLSTSAIALGDSSGSDTDIWGVGRIPAVADVEAAVAAQLPDDVVYDRKTNQSKPNVSAMFYDDGHGNISGACTGTINYETGAIDLNGCPPNANFVVSAAYGSAHSGGEEYTSTLGNSISLISGRSVNPKINSTIEIIGLQ